MTPTTISQRYSRRRPSDARCWHSTLSSSRPSCVSGEVCVGHVSSNSRSTPQGSSEAAGEQESFWECLVPRRRPVTPSTVSWPRTRRLPRAAASRHRHHRPQLLPCWPLPTVHVTTSASTVAPACRAFCWPLPTITIRTHQRVTTLLTTSISGPPAQSEIKFVFAPLYAIATDKTTGFTEIIRKCKPVFYVIRSAVYEMSKILKLITASSWTH